MSHLVRHFIFANVCCAASLFFIEPASAQTETFVTSSYLGSGTVSAPHDFSIPSFNTSLGTLNGVDISLKINLCPVLRLDNTTSANIAFTNATIDEPVDITAPGTSEYVMNLDDTVKSGTAKPGVTTEGLARIPTYGSEQVAPSELNLWDTGQKVSIDLTPTQPIFGGWPQNPGLLFGGSATEWANITVEYLYTPNLATPEPPGKYLSALVGLAMIVAAFGRRKLHGI